DVGVAITGVLENSPAQRAGLLPGDLIKKVNAQQIKTSAQVQKLVESSSVGEILQVEVNRNGGFQTFEVQLGAYPQKK
ncbi:MAG: PDZ domain-containing protein, partial [Microcystaceae cyanobacterium]